MEEKNNQEIPKGNMDLINRIDAILPSVLSGAIVGEDAFRLFEDLRYPKGLRTPTTTEEAREFLKLKREELQ